MGSQVAHLKHEVSAPHLQEDHTTGSALKGHRKLGIGCSLADSDLGIDSHKCLLKSQPLMIKATLS